MSKKARNSQIEAHGEAMRRADALAAVAKAATEVAGRATSLLEKLKCTSEDMKVNAEGMAADTAALVAKLNRTSSEIAFQAKEVMAATRSHLKIEKSLSHVATEAYSSVVEENASMREEIAILKARLDAALASVASAKEEPPEWVVKAVSRRPNGMSEAELVELSRKVYVWGKDFLGRIKLP